jgi:hypothetical protein
LMCVYRYLIVQSPRADPLRGGCCRTYASDATFTTGDVQPSTPPCYSMRPRSGRRPVDHCHLMAIRRVGRSRIIAATPPPPSGRRIVAPRAVRSERTASSIPACPPTHFPIYAEIAMFKSNGAYRIEHDRARGPEPRHNRPHRPHLYPGRHACPPQIAVGK